MGRRNHGLGYKLRKEKLVNSYSYIALWCYPISMVNVLSVRYLCQCQSMYKMTSGLVICQSMFKMTSGLMMLFSSLSMNWRLSATLKTTSSLREGECWCTVRQIMFLLQIRLSRWNFVCCSSFTLDVLQR